MERLESVELETVPVTSRNITVVPPVEEVGGVTPGLSLSIWIPAFVVITNPGPVVFGRVVAMGMGEVRVPVLAVSSTPCLFGFSPVVNPDTSITILIPNTLRNITLLRFSLTDIAEGLVSKVNSIRVLAVMVGGCPSSHGGSFPVDTGLSALRNISDSSMELPSLFQVAEHVVKDGLQGLHGVDDLLNVLSSISFGYRHKVGSEVALFVEFKLSPDYFQRSRSEVQM